MNGDSICPVDFPQFYDFHIEKGGILSIVLTRPLSENAYGVVEVDSENRIVAFREKVGSRRGSFINAGIYMAERRIFDHMPAKASFSLEYDLFPKILPRGCYGFRTDADLIDIGTPERYVQALRRLSPSNSNEKLL
jgi:NDP-sugar pyrophosphorylase family protein